MGKRRRAEPVSDPRSEFLDRLLADPAGVRAEREARARAFWTERARISAREVAQHESAVPLLMGADRAGAEIRLKRALRASAEAARRAGLAPEALLEEARAEVAKQDGSVSEASVARALGILASDADGQRASEGAGNGEEAAGEGSSEERTLGRGDVFSAVTNATTANVAHGRGIAGAEQAGQKRRVLPGGFVGGCLHCRKPPVSGVKTGVRAVFEEVTS